MYHLVHITSHNLPYEKVGKNEPVCIADEVPFEIPESWEWVRLGNVIELQSGQDMTPDKYNSRGDGIPYITGASNIENGKVLINRWTDCGRAFAYKGDILLTCKGTVGTMAVLQESQVHIARQIMAIRPIGELYVSYIQLVLQTLVESLKAAAKSMIPGIARDDVLQSLFPVPPFNEQQRIAGKFSTIVPYMKQYSMADTKLSSLNSIFPEALKKSILQEAVQGKLVPQDPSDEPASALLERIRAEKDRLIQEGKIKRDKYESVIYRRDNSHYEKLDGIERCIDDQIPFEIPETWEWCRLKTIGITQTGNTPSKAHPEYIGDEIPFITPGDIQNGTVFYDNQALSMEGKMVARICPEGSILQVCIGGSIGKVAIANKKVCFNQQINSISPIIICSEYIYTIMQSSYFLKNIKKQAGGTATPIINRGIWDYLLIPIAPISEQKRIVEKQRELFNKISLN